MEEQAAQAGQLLGAGEVVGVDVVTKAPVRVTYTYDERNRLTGADYGDGRKITYAYDAAGNLVQMAVEAPAPPAAPVALSPPTETPAAQAVIPEEGPPTLPQAPPSGPAKVAEPPSPLSAPASPKSMGAPPGQSPRDETQEATTSKFKESPVIQETLRYKPLILSAISGSMTGKRFSLADSGVIGRMPENDIVLEDAHVSRRHVRLQRQEDGAWWVEDLKSANGTFVNGEKVVEPRRLQDGDELQLGDSAFEVRVGKGQSA